MVFMQTVAAVARTDMPQITLLLTCGSCSKKGGDGKFLLVSDGRADQVAKQAMAALGGRGGGRNGVLQGKTATLTPDSIDSAVAVLRQALA